MDVWAISSFPCPHGIGLRELGDVFHHKTFNYFMYLVNRIRGPRKAWPNRDRGCMTVLYKYIRRVITSGEKELFNARNMLAEEQMVMNYLPMNKFTLEIS